MKHLTQSEKSALVTAISSDLALTAVGQMQDRQDTHCLDCLGSAYLEGMIKAGATVYVAGNGLRFNRPESEMDELCKVLINTLIDTASEIINKDYNENVSDEE